MKKLEQTYHIHAAIASVWDALTNIKTIAAWGAGPAIMEMKNNGKFSLWGGDIYGKNNEITRNKRLVQDWYSGDWKTPSRVTFTLSAHDGTTIINLLHENIPDREFTEITDGWNRYYLGEIKKYLEKTRE